MMCPKSGDKCLPTDRLELVFLPMANILFTNYTIGWHLDQWYLYGTIVNVYQ
jgi:hypothetical protein